MLLLAQWVEAGHGADRAVVLNSARDFFCEVVAEFEIRRKDDALRHIRAVKCAIERGIDGPIPSAYFLINDGANLPGPRVQRKLPSLIANLVRETNSHWPGPLCRNPESRPYVVAHPLPSLAGVHRGKNVEAAFEIIGEAVGDFNRFVLGMISGIEPVEHELRAIDREVAMQFNHGVTRLDQVGAVHLNFIVILRKRGNSKYDETSDRQSGSSKASLQFRSSPQACGCALSYTAINCWMLACVYLWVVESETWPRSS